MRRIGPKGAGEFVETTWDEALDLFADKISQAVETHGWAAVVPYLYSSSAGNLAQAGLSPLVWEHFGAARTDITICAAVVGEAWHRTYGSMASADPRISNRVNLIVVWGANPNVSHPHLSPVIEERRRAGARLIVVDPRRTRIATRSDLHLAVRPGTDGVLAMAVAALLQHNGHIDLQFIERWVDGSEPYLAACQEWTPARAADVCDVDASDIETFAEMYGTIRPAMLRVGWGQERNRNGGSASRAVFALPALAGQFGVPGSGVFNSISGGTGFDEDAVRRGIVGDAPLPARRAINMNRLGRILTDDEGGRVEVLFVQGSNPAATCPEQAVVLQGLARDDLFTVVHDLTMTDTARFADLVLPATSQFEVDEIVGSYGSFVMQEAPAVIRESARVVPTTRSVSVSASAWVSIRNSGIPTHSASGGWLSVTGCCRSPSSRRVASCSSATSTPAAGCSWSATLSASTRFLRIGRSTLPDLPITLITPATSRTTSSMFGNIAPANGDLHLHPTDAASRGLIAGDRATITDGRHTIEATVTIDATLRRGVATMPKGMWRRDGHDGFTANVFAPDHLADLAGGATLQRRPGRGVGSR